MQPLPLFTLEREMLALSVCEADVIIAAVGRPEMVQPDWVKEGAIVVDVRNVMR